jgi:hypothetical protein
VPTTAVGRVRELRYQVISIYLYVRGEQLKFYIYLFYYKLCKSSRKFLILPPKTHNEG